MSDDHYLFLKLVMVVEERSSFEYANLLTRREVIYVLCVVFLLQCHNEFFKVSVTDLDIFAGIERNRIDVKNPMPTR